ncbi:MAG: metal-dependent transcriptional regulator [Herpetosiphon sp.]
MDAGPSSAKLSQAMQDYVKVIYMLQQHGEVTTSSLADHLHFAPSSVTSMLQRLAKLDLVSYTPYHGVQLTGSGEGIALEVIRRHRLIELFLVEVLNYSWDEVHDDAEILEHAISDTLVTRIAARLGNPIVDPHGDPIPLSDLTLPATEDHLLADLPVGSMGEVTRVTDQDAARLRYLAKLGLVPKARVIVRDRAPFDGPLTVQISDKTYPIDSRIANAIVVLPIE